MQSFGDLTKNPDNLNNILPHNVSQISIDKSLALDHFGNPDLSIIEKFEKKEGEPKVALQTEHMMLQGQGTGLGQQSHTGQHVNPNVKSQGMAIQPNQKMIEPNQMKILSKLQNHKPKLMDSIDRKQSFKVKTIRVDFKKPRKKLSFQSNSFAHPTLSPVTKTNSPTEMMRKPGTKKVGKISSFQMKLKKKLKQKKLNQSLKNKNANISLNSLIGSSFWNKGSHLNLLFNVFLNVR